jgi:hypothetical protein
VHIEARVVAEIGALVIVEHDKVGRKRHKIRTLTQETRMCG